MTKNNASKLVEDNKRLVEYEAGKYFRFIPPPVVLAEAYKLAHKAAESYDESSGHKFSTHLVNQLKKLSRISTQYGASVRLPENKQFKMQKLTHIQHVLREELGREPTMAELADATGLPMKEINFILQHKKAEVNIANLAYTPTFVDNDNDDWLHFVYHDLSDTDKLIFELKTGFGGKPVSTNEEIATKLNLPVSTVNSRVRVITTKVEEGWREH